MLIAKMLAAVLAGARAELRGPLSSLVTGRLLMAAGSAMAGLSRTFAMLLAGRPNASLGGSLRACSALP